MYEIRKDPFTGEEFTPKRYNQTFASRKNQIAFNNDKARVKRKQKSKVDKALDRNRNILSSILKSSSEVVKSIDFLLGAGFNFQFFSQSANIGGVNCQFIYEFYIVDNKNRTFTIKKFNQ